MLKTSVIAELKKIVGSANLAVSPEEMVAYSFDATRLEAIPWAVVRPASAPEISRIVLLANRERLPVTPRGAGTGMSGGSVPAAGGLVLSLERMNRILEIDEADLIAVVEPGVITGDFQREVEGRGLFYPPDPASRDFCTIGGNVAECAGGLRAVKYGVTRDYVLGLEVVLPTGEIIKTGGRTLKSVAGFDLTRLIVGSEGTLGIVTKIFLKLLPLPETVRTVRAFFPSITAAASAASEIISGRILPRALELVDRSALRAAATYLKDESSEGAAAMLIAEVDGPGTSTEADLDRIVQIMNGAGASGISRAESDLEREELWRLRRAISPALYTLKPKKINEDIVVPRSKIPEVLSAIDRIAERYGLLIVNFGHAGDGNIHTNIMIDEKDTRKAEAAVKEILEAVLALNGSISGEHGIGLSKAAFLPLEIVPDALLLMKKIKLLLDPNMILNPGKIFLEDPEPVGTPGPGSSTRHPVKKTGKFSGIFGKILFCLFLSILCSPSVQADAGPVPVSALREEVRGLEHSVRLLEEENLGLRRMLEVMDSGEIYLVVDTETNRLTMRNREKIVRTAICGTGSRQFVEEETGRSWFFETPLGSFTVLGKERNPVWIRPDWSYVEENMPVPAKDDSDRIVRGVLGKYALVLGSGYKIHGTTYTNLLGTHFTHGCVSLGDKDLEAVYKAVGIGTKVYIY